MSRPFSSAPEASNTRKTVTFAGTTPPSRTIRERREPVNDGLVRAMSEEDINSFAGRVRQDQAQRQYLQNQAQQHAQQWQHEKRIRSHSMPTATMATSSANQSQTPHQASQSMNSGITSSGGVNQQQQQPPSTPAALAASTSSTTVTDRTHTAPQIPVVNNTNVEIPNRTAGCPPNNNGTAQEAGPPPPHMRSFLNPPGNCGMYGYPNAFGALGGTGVFFPPGYQQPAFPTMIGPEGQPKPFLYHNPPMAAPSIQPPHPGAPSWTHPRESPFFANNHGSLNNPPPYITGQQIIPQAQMMVPMAMSPIPMVAAQVPAVMCAVPIQQQPVMGMYSAGGSCVGSGNSGGGCWRPPGPTSVQYFL